ncbi:helix-turn-helix domain-containing protein [Rhodococcus rhodochrous]|uniref:helix-turn-helix domain-containing protein n=1 Tax=Rhodococcus rhodochrous TaxID=1829 RepID=UPI0023F8A3B5
MIAFGPQLIGRTEKALNALLAMTLADEDLVETQWVALRLAERSDRSRTLPALLHDTTYAPDTAAVVDSLVARGLIRDDRPSASGRETVARIEHRIDELTSGIWEAVDPADRAAAERALNTVLDRARSVIATRSGR